MAEPVYILANDPSAPLQGDDERVLWQKIVAAWRAKFNVNITGANNDLYFIQNVYDKSAPREIDEPQMSMMKLLACSRNSSL